MTVDTRVAGEISDQGLAFKNLDQFEATKGWLDQSVSWVIATRGFYHAKVVDSWDMLDWPMNQARTGRLTALKMEVGEAYNYLFRLTLDKDFCETKYPIPYAEMIHKTKFVFTSEEDNILPPNAVTGLFAAIYTCPDCGEDIVDSDEWKCGEGHRGYDAVSGLYFTKTLPPRPMAYGDPKNGEDDFRPRSVKKAVEDRSTIEVNGIAMGCALWRKDIFRKVSEPWFQTLQSDNQNGGGAMTQDLYFCQKAKEEAGARFGVHCGVKVGHIDYKTGQVY